jgi:hypothetical protein
MSVICKLRCFSKNVNDHTMNSGEKVKAAQVSFSAVYDAEGKNQENKIFGDATPSASLTMYITNEAAHAQFEVGEDYYVRIEKAPR